MSPSPSGNFGYSRSSHPRPPQCWRSPASSGSLAFRGVFFSAGGGGGEVGGLRGWGVGVGGVEGWGLGVGLGVGGWGLGVGVGGWGLGGWLGVGGLGLGGWGVGGLGGWEVGGLGGWGVGGLGGLRGGGGGRGKREGGWQPKMAKSRSHVVPEKPHGLHPMKACFGVVCPGELCHLLAMEEPSEP